MLNDFYLEWFPRVLTVDGWNLKQLYVCPERDSNPQGRPLLYLQLIQATTAGYILSIFITKKLDSCFFNFKSFADAL